MKTTTGQRSFTGLYRSQISFPLGGIGTGSVGLSGTGGLRDWEIFNRPNIGSIFPFTFPILFAKETNGVTHCRVLEGPPTPPHVGSGVGDPHLSGEGFPHMDSNTFRGEYPFAYVDFQCKKLPITVSLEAYNPFIPSDPDTSGFPGAILHYTLTNRSQKRVDATLAWSLVNPIGGSDTSAFGGNVNEKVEEGGLRGILFSSQKWASNHPNFGSVALVTPTSQVTLMSHWLREGWYTPKHEFWDTFSTTGMLPEHHYGPSDDGQRDAGAVGARVTLKPGETRRITFYLTWYFPNFEKYWHNGSGCCTGKDCSCPPKPLWRNYYANHFQDALDVARKLHAQEHELYAITKCFHDALFSSTMPPSVLDAVSSQMAILKTTTCARLEDGTFYAFEGCWPQSGCCEGSCTHVWNYQQTLPFLFPSLERSMRNADYHHNLRADGGMCFRLQLPLGSPPDNFHACSDGQLGGIIKVYRDWKICGDLPWLQHLWPKVRRALEYAWVTWDSDRDGVIDGIQHNTYDIEFLGPNPLVAGFYLGALVAGAEMADALGETETAATYRAIYEKGRAWVDSHLFNGEYYVQQYDPEQAPRFQFGNGCLTDQLLGQWLASVSGLGDVLEPRHVKRTLKSIYKYNWRKSLAGHANAQRVYALNDESGLLLCSWPKGGRPAIPFPYSDEVWTGCEYQAASHMIEEGLVKEGLAIVQGARDRHDGLKRNPWDEFECGHHYARAMAAYGLILALSGFTYNKGMGTLGFAPRIHAKNFKTFWALDGVWGTYTQNEKSASLSVLWGTITLSRMDLPLFASPGTKILLRKGARTSTVEADAYGSITFVRVLSLHAGQTLSLTH